MHCLAITLDVKTNTLLNKIGKEIFTFQKLSMMIEKFHLTLLCVEDIKGCEIFINEYQENNFIFSRMKPMKWTVLEGKNTNFDYLTVEVLVPARIKKEIIRLRQKIDPNTSNHLDLKPHISVMRAPKGSFSGDLIDLLNKKYSHLPAFKTKDMLLFSNEFELVKKTRISEIKPKTKAPASI